MLATTEQLNNGTTEQMNNGTTEQPVNLDSSNLSNEYSDKIKRIIDNMSIPDIDERFKVAEGLLPNKDMSENIQEYKNLIQESHEHGKDRFGILYKKEIEHKEFDKDFSDDEKSELQQIRFGKGLILMRGKNDISFSREEAEILMENGIVGMFDFLKNNIKKYYELGISSDVEKFFGGEVEDDFKKIIGGLKEDDLEKFKLVIGFDIENISDTYLLELLKNITTSIDHENLKEKIENRISFLQEEFKKEEEEKLMKSKEEELMKSKEEKIIIDDGLDNLIPNVCKYSKLANKEIIDSYNKEKLHREYRIKYMLSLRKSLNKFENVDFIEMREKEIEGDNNLKFYLNQSARYLADTYHTPTGRSYEKTDFDIFDKNCHTVTDNLMARDGVLYKDLPDGSYSEGGEGFNRTLNIANDFLENPTEGFDIEEYNKINKKDSVNSSYGFLQENAELDFYYYKYDDNGKLTHIKVFHQYHRGSLFVKTLSVNELEDNKNSFIKKFKNDEDIRKFINNKIEEKEGIKYRDLNIEGINNSIKEFNDKYIGKLKLIEEIGYNNEKDISLKIINKDFDILKKLSVDNGLILEERSFGSKYQFKNNSNEITYLEEDFRIDLSENIDFNILKQVISIISNN